MSQRLRDERGSGLVAGLVLMFAFTLTALVWLARDVDRSVSNRSTASSIAFQAARSGAQAASIADLRAGGSSANTLDQVGAEAAARRTAATLFANYDVTGTIEVVVRIDEVDTVVTITDSGRSVTGAATVRAERTS